jgi:hypothetical protein
MKKLSVAVNAIQMKLAPLVKMVAIAVVAIATIAQVNAVSVGITHKLTKQPMLKM